MRLNESTLFNSVQSMADFLSSQHRITIGTHPDYPGRALVCSLTGDRNARENFSNVTEALALQYAVWLDTLLSRNFHTSSLSSYEFRDVYACGDNFTFMDLLSVLSSIETWLTHVDECENLHEDFTSIALKRYLHRRWDDEPCGRFALTVARPFLERLQDLLREEEFEACWADLYQAAVFIKRLPLCGMDLGESALNSWMEIDSNLPTEHFTVLEGTILSDWFPTASFPKLCLWYNPKHGNGAVAEPGIRTINEKWHAIGSDTLIRHMELQIGCFIRSDRRRDPGSALVKPIGVNTKSFERTSRLAFVPKTATKVRSICMEPATLMYHQQGWLKAITRYIKWHPYLRRRINLERAELNKRDAYLGSIDGSIATIDLSAASDSVSLSLVKSWFHNTSLRLPLLATRSYKTKLPTGETWQLNKYASMGSALCFPVECLVFAAVCEAAITECGDNPGNSMYRVYGDDIVIESKYADTVIERLTHNGFTINKEKSFVHKGANNFRESCGGFYLNGYDVTPNFLSRFFVNSKSGRRRSQMSTYVQQRIELANACYHRLPLTRRAVLLTLRTLPLSLRVPFVDPLRYWGDQNNTGLITPYPTNHHLKTDGKYSDCESNITYGTAIMRSVVQGPKDESIRLYETLRNSVPYQPSYNQLGPKSLADIRSFHRDRIRFSFGRLGTQTDTRTYSSPKWVSVTTPRWLL